MYYLYSLVLFFPIIDGQQIPSVELKSGNLDDQITELFNNCKCVIFYKCDEQNFIIPHDEIKNRKVSSQFKNLTSLVSIKRIRCSNAYYYCCRNKTEIMTTTTSSTTTVQPTRFLYPSTSIANVPLQRPLSTSTITPIIFNRNRIENSYQKCGQGNSNGPTVLDEFPWIVSIRKSRKNSPNDLQYKCGGSLIHPYVILTAQHCISSSNAELFKITAKCNQIFPTHSAITRNVSKIIKHPSYYSDVNNNDISLLILSEPINEINPVCLPSSQMNFDGQRCYAAGWGSSVRMKRNETLRKVDLPVVDFNRCKTLLRRTNLGSGFELHSSFICAGGEEEGKDTCSGDGGGPLMCQIGNRYIQAGIVSWGLRCGLLNVPSMYTSVATLSGWIDEQLLRENITINKY